MPLALRFLRVTVRPKGLYARPIPGRRARIPSLSDIPSARCRLRRARVACLRLAPCRVAGSALLPRWPPDKPAPANRQRPEGHRRATSAVPVAGFPATGSLRRRVAPAASEARRAKASRERALGREKEFFP